MNTSRAGVKHALLSHPTPARAGHVGSLLLRCVQAFFEADPVASEQPPDRTATTANPSLAQSEPIASPHALPVAKCYPPSALPLHFQFPASVAAISPRSWH